jgi:hypothetical protein
VSVNRPSVAQPRSPHPWVSRAPKTVPLSEGSGTAERASAGPTEAESLRSPCRGPHALTFIATASVLTQELLLPLSLSICSLSVVSIYPRARGCGRGQRPWTRQACVRDSTGSSDVRRSRALARSTTTWGSCARARAHGRWPPGRGRATTTRQGVCGWRDGVPRPGRIPRDSCHQRSSRLGRHVRRRWSLDGPVSPPGCVGPVLLLRSCKEGPGRPVRVTAAPAALGRHACAGHILGTDTQR